MKVVDVIVVAYNEENAISTTLSSIAGQKEAGVLFEVLVVPNGCTDRTAQVARDTIDQLPIRPDMNFKVIELGQSGKNRSLNYALSQTDAPLVFCLDSDVTLSPDCFAIVLESFEDPSVKVSGAEPQVLVNDALQGTMIGQLYKVRELEKDVVGGSMVPIGRMMAFRRGVTSGWPLSYVGAEDTWLPLEVANKFGWHSVIVAKGAEVYAVPPQNWLDLVRQESRWRLNYARLIRHFPDLAEVAKNSPRRVTVQRPLSAEQRRALADLMMEHHIPAEVLKLHELLPQILQDNAKVMGSKLASEDGTWEPIASTKVGTNVKA